jgi:hypothetical protein
MKKFIYALPLMLGLILFSFSYSTDGDGEKVAAKVELGDEMCDCAETSLEMMKEIKEADGDEEIMKELYEKYKDDMEACQKVGEAFQKELEGKSEEEQEEIEEEFVDNCEAMQELEKMMKEM